MRAALLVVLALGLPGCKVITDSELDEAADTGVVETDTDTDTDTDADTDTDTDADTDTDTDADTDADTDTDVNAPPSCTITAPANSDTLGFDQWALAATATDPEDGTLGAQDVAWSSDVDGALGTGTALDVSLSDGSHTLTCTATDSGGLTGTDTVTVTSLSPYVEITEPADGTTVAANDRVRLNGTASDLEDGGLGITWTSSVDGPIGNPAQFRPTAGTHTITAEATDSNGNVATDTITLNVN